VCWKHPSHGHFHASHAVIGTVFAALSDPGRAVVIKNLIHAFRRGAYPSQLLSTMYEAFRKYGGYPYEESQKPSGFLEIASVAMRRVDSVGSWSQNYRPQAQQPGGPSSELHKWAGSVTKPYFENVKKHLAGMKKWADTITERYFNGTMKNPDDLSDLDGYEKALRDLASVLDVPVWIAAHFSIHYRYTLYSGRCVVPGEWLAALDACQRGSPDTCVRWSIRFSPHCEIYLIKKNLVESIDMSPENIPERITNLTGPNSMVIRLTDVYNVIDDSERRNLIDTLVPDCVVMIDSQTGEIFGADSSIEKLWKAYNPSIQPNPYDSIALERAAELDKIYSDPSYDITRSLPVVCTSRAPYLGYSKQQMNIKLLESFPSITTRKRIFDQLVADSIGIKPDPIHTNILLHGYVQDEHNTRAAIHHIYHVADAVITSPSYYPGHPNYFLFPYDIRTYKGLPVAEHCPEYIFFIEKGLIKHDQLMEFIDTVLETKGYEFAVSFVRPLLGLTNINHNYFLYFLSRIYLSSITDKTHPITDYCNRIISQLPEIEDPHSNIYSTYLSVCQGSPMKPVRLMINDPPSLNYEMQESLVRTALDILKPLVVVVGTEQVSESEEINENIVNKVDECPVARPTEQTIKAPLFGLSYLRTTCSVKPDSDFKTPRQAEDDPFSIDKDEIDYLSDDDQSDENTSVHLARSERQSISNTNILDILRYLQDHLITPELKDLTKDFIAHLITGKPELPPIYDDEIPALSVVDENQPLKNLKPEEILSHLIERGIDTLNPTLCDGAALILRMIQAPQPPLAPVYQNTEDLRERTIIELVLDTIAYYSGMIGSIS
jgi:sulfur relay (sulfurtransferase) DsrC/TusE family protein